MLRVLATSDPIECAVAEIRHVVRKTAIDLALDVGEIVLHHVFQGDLAAVRFHGPKDVSFRRLATHPELPMSAASLWRAVALYELCSRLPRIRHSSFLTATHVYAVLGLPDGEQETLLVRAEGERLSAAKLRTLVAEQRRALGGRPPKPDVLKALDALRHVAGLPVTAFRDRHAIGKLSAEELDVARATLAELDERLRELRRLLGRM